MQAASSPRHQHLYNEMTMSFKTVGSLSLEGRQAVCRALMAEGKAEWLAKDNSVCLVTVQPMQQWAATMQTTVRTRFTSNVVMLEELNSGEDAEGTGLTLSHTMIVFAQPDTRRRCHLLLGTNPPCKR